MKDALLLVAVVDDFEHEDGDELLEDLEAVAGRRLVGSRRVRGRIVTLS